MISPEEQSAIAVAVTALTQVIKWSKVLPDKATVFVVFLLSGAGVGAIVYDHAASERVGAITIIALFANLVLTAAGVYGMARGVPETVMTTKPQLAPPSNDDV